MAATSRGIDVSDNNGTQDWKALAAGGVTFAQVKASEGEHTQDPKYRTHMDGLRAAGIMPMAYHFAWPNQDAATEAANYVSAVKADADDVPGFVHWLDLERMKTGENYAGRTAAQIKAYATTWVDRVKAAFPKQRVGVYTSGSDITAGHYPANSDGFWYPAYPSGPLSYTQAEQRSKPNPGRTPLLWQFASSPTDRSIAYMTPAALRAWAGQEDDVALTAAEKDALALIPKLYDNLINIDSIDVKDAKGVPVRHAAGYHLAHIFHDTSEAIWPAMVKMSANLAALQSAVAALAQGGGITAEQVQAAAEAGAQAALAELGGALTEQAPEPAAD